MRAHVLAAALLITGCSHAGNQPAEQPATQQPTTVQVENSGVSDMDVFFLARGQRFRLGSVIGGHTETFTLPAAMVVSSTQAQFEMRPLGGGASPRSQTILLRPGDHLHLVIPPS